MSDVITNREQAVKRIADLVQEAREKMKEAVNLANEWEIVVEYNLYHPEGNSYGDETSWYSSDEWEDSGC